MTVQGTTGTTIVLTRTTTFKLRISNPCFNPSFVSITSAALPTGSTYTLYANSIASPYSLMTHTAWIVTTTPITHTLCGAITYTATFEGSPVSTTTISTVGVTYSSATRTFAIYSENLSLIGNNRAVTVSASLTSYSTITTGPVSGTVKIIDPCLTPQSLTAPTQTNPTVYTYTGASPKLTFTSTKFVVYPPICTPTYSCTMTSGPRTDICNKIDGTTVATFTSSTGDYTF